MQWRSSIGFLDFRNCSLADSLRIGCGGEDAFSRQHTAIPPSGFDVSTGHGAAVFFGAPSVGKCVSLGGTAFTCAFLSFSPVQTGRYIIHNYLYLGVLIFICIYIFMCICCLHGVHRVLQLIS